MSTSTSPKGVSVTNGLRREPDSEELAYLAGYFDGEGCVTVASGLRMLVSATYPTGCQRLQEAFGGRVVRRKSDPGDKVIYQWTCFGERAEVALKALRPYLREKWSQATYAILWYNDVHGDKFPYQDWIASDKRVSWDLPHSSRVRPRPISKESAGA